MYAYRVGNVKYNLRRREGGTYEGRGSVWLSPDSILIKENERWLYIQGEHIENVKMERNNLLLSLINKSSVELNSKNVYILSALYHYIEGAIWKEA